MRVCVSGGVYVRVLARVCVCVAVCVCMCVCGGVWRFVCVHLRVPVRFHGQYMFYHYIAGRAGSVSTHLRAVDVLGYTLQACRDSSYPASWLYAGMMCAGVEGGGKDACQVSRIRYYIIRRADVHTLNIVIYFGVLHWEILLWTVYILVNNT